MAENIALTFANNEDWRKTFTLKDADNNVIDLSDATDWQLTVRKEAKPDSSVAIRATGGSAGNSWLLRKTPHSGGQVELAIPATEVKAITAGSYVYDIVVWKPGKVLRPTAGTLTVEQGITPLS